VIAKVIQWCVHNRAMVLLLTGFLIVAGMWSAKNITIDAIPDLSDVQVIVRTEFPGQAPQIVEDQVTYPLTTTMLAVPYAKVVRGYSMFGSSFVYIIFEDGTDMYWARSRVLEQLNFVASQLPSSVSPQLGPDATGVGWVYEYTLVTGKYCPNHPNGAWHDPDTDQWYAVRGEAPSDEEVQERLVLHRVYDEGKTVYYDQQENQRYESPDDAPADARSRLRPVELEKGYDRCPLDGTMLVASDRDLSDLRGLQDWYLRYELTAVEGVSEVASAGGFVKQYQIVVDPVKLLAYKIPLGKVKMAIKRSNIDVGGSLIETSETEYMVRGVGYLGSLSDQEVAQALADHRPLEDVRTEKVLDELRRVSLGATEDGVPIYLRDVAEMRTGPDKRRGVTDWNGKGETVGGIIVMRFGENAQTTIQRVRDRLEALEEGLPPGVAIDVAYDRSDLIERAVETLRGTLIEEITIVSLVCIIFLLHARSALVAAFVLPTGVLATITLMYIFGINANIMSLGGIAISIGVMVDSAIIMVENAHKHTEFESDRVAAGHKPRPQIDVIAEAAAEVGPSLFFALLIIVVSFLPIFVLGEQSGRLFKPLAFTKTFAMACGAVLAITIIPVLMAMFISERVVPEAWSRLKQWSFYLTVIALPAVVLALIPMPSLGNYRWHMVLGWLVLGSLMVLPQKIPHEHRNPVSRLLEWIYNPFFNFFMAHNVLTIVIATVMVAATLWPLSQLGSEFMPPLEEGDLLYMPTADPGISLTKAGELLQQTDALIKQFPEVESVFGKIGRAETATDPAPPSMMETIIMLNRDKSKWRQVPRNLDHWPTGTQWLGHLLLSDTRPITIQELIYGYDFSDDVRVPGLNETVQIPGLTNAWTMPIKTRIDMLSTGIKTPIGIKVLGPDLQVLSDLANEIANVVKTSEGTAAYTVSAFPEKSVGGNYFDFKINRDEIARYGLTIADVQDVIMSAMGGMNVSSTVEGLERYPINLRYPQELRDNIESLRQVLVGTPSGAQVPIGQLAQIQIHKGPPQVKSENARLTSWVYVDIDGLDVGTYVANAQKAVGESVVLPAGYSIIWSGQFEYMQAAKARLSVAVPMTIVLIVLLLYIGTRSWLQVGIVLVSLPLAMVGAIWMLWALDYNLSLAVGVGMIALAGLATETGIVMLLYLETSFQRFETEGRMRNRNDLWHAIHDGAVKRIRPKTMTVMAILMGMTPMLWAAGAGADTMRRLAVPMIGGVSTSFILELLVFPVLYYIAKRVALARRFSGHHGDALEDAA
jgi:copper/silver efflux system protein